MNLSTFLSTRSPQFNARFFWIIAFGIFLIAVISWFSGVPELRNWIGHYMKANTAIGGFACTVALGIFLYYCDESNATLRGPAKTIFLIYASFGALLGLATFLQYFTDQPFGIDEFFVKDIPAVNSPRLFDGRMSPNSSLGLFFSGYAIATMILPSTSGFRKLASFLIWMNVSIYSIALIGHTYGVKMLYKISSFTAISEVTCFSFLMLNGALFYLKRLDPGIQLVLGNGVGASLARRLIGPIIIIPIIMGGLRLEGQRLGYYSLEEGTAFLIVALTVIFSIAILKSSQWLNDLDVRKTGAERDLKLTQERLHRLFDSNVAGVFYYHLSGPILEANNAFLSMLGYTREDLKAGKINWKNITPQEWESRDAVAKEHILMKGEVNTYEKEYFRKDGTRIPIVIGAALFDDSKEEGVAFVLDASELKAAIRARDEFLSIASHELRTPITSMKLHNQLFQREIRRNNTVVFEPARVTKFVDQVDRQISRLERLINDMLDVGRINTGTFEMRYEDFIDLNTLISEVAERYAPNLQEAECKVVLNFKTQLFIRADRYRLEQVFLNLLSNAARYAPSSKVEIKSEQKGSQAILTIKDNGPGIPLEKQERIFNRFEKASHKEAGGLGLGLYIVKQILARHYGTISVQSAMKKGTVFTIEIPTQSEAERD